MNLALLFKSLIVLLLLSIVFNLFRALWVMMHPSHDKPMSHYLGRRVLLSALVLLLLLLALTSGVITPHSRPY